MGDMGEDNDGLSRGGHRSGESMVVSALMSRTSLGRFGVMRVVTPVDRMDGVELSEEEDELSIVAIM